MDDGERLWGFYH